MKQFLILVFYTLSLNLAFAQPTITNDWFYTIGDTIITEYYYPLVYQAPAEGLDLTWDFSNGEAPRGQRERIMVDPTTLTYHNDFPDATIAYLNTVQREFYLKIENGMLHQLGIRSPSRISKYENGTPLLAADGFEYGEMLESNYDNVQIDPQDMSTIFTLSKSEELSFVGFGTVITPKGTFENCVMLRLHNWTNDILQQIQYSFYQDRLTNPILQYTTYPAGNTEPANSVEYQIEEKTITKLSEVLPTKIQLSGPIANRIQVQSAYGKQIDAQIQIIDVAGRVLWEHLQNIEDGDNEILLDFELSQGNYFLLLVNREDGSFYTHRFNK